MDGSLQPVFHRAATDARRWSVALRPTLQIALTSSHRHQFCFWHSSVGIATGYGLDDRDVKSSSPGRDKNFLFSMTSRPALGSTQPPIQLVPGALSPGVKRPRREAHRSPAVSAEVKKMLIYTSTPRDFTFFFFTFTLATATNMNSQFDSPWRAWATHTATHAFIFR
jgi:hypothetical protein